MTLKNRPRAAKRNSKAAKKDPKQLKRRPKMRQETSKRVSETLIRSPADPKRTKDAKDEIIITPF